MSPRKGCRAFDTWPLDEILGSLACVKVLRTVVENPIQPVWPTDVMRQTGLSRSGVWNGLNRLVDAKIVEPAWAEHGRIAAFRLVEYHRLARPIVWLYAREREALWRARLVRVDLTGRGPYDRRRLLDRSRLLSPSDLLDWVQADPEPTRR